MDEDKVLESHGLHEFERIGRPSIWYDNRSTYGSNMAEHIRTMNERKGNRTLVDDVSETEIINDIIGV